MISQWNGGGAAKVVSALSSDVVLDARQNSVVDAVKAGRSVLVTGPAGTGKSQILATLSNSIPIAITATTGIAAVNVGGATIHSWAGLGIMVDPQLIVDKMSARVKDRIRNTNFLAIDELSMMSDWMFEVLNWVLQYVRCNKKPFGGMVMVMFADFLQLPPVAGNGEDDVEWPFQCDAWAALNPKVVLLEKIYRQDDTSFQDMLNDVRFGRIRGETAVALMSRIDARDPEPDKPGVKLYCTNRDVDGENEVNLAAVDAPEFRHPAIDWAINDQLLPRLDKDCRMPKVFKYKVGARVMLLINTDVDSGLANGSIGTITSVDPATRHPTVTFDNGEVSEVEPVATEIHSITMSGGRPVQEVIASRTQYPLRLAYAITIHKCVAADTLVPTERGLMRMDGLCSMADLPRVAGKVGLNGACEPFIGKVELGYRITTKRGFSLIGSERHPLLSVLRDGDGWVKAPELRVGDHLRLRRSTFVEGDFDLQAGFERVDYHIHSPYHLPSRMNPQLAWLFGALTGDGCFTDERDGRVDVTSLDDEVITQFEEAMMEQFGLTSTVASPKAKRVRVAYVHNVGVRRFLLHLGLGYTKAGSKRIPPCILQSPVECQGAFLRGLFDTDGGVNSCIHHTTSSIGLSRDVQVLLANLGVVGTIDPMIFPSWRINVSGVDAAQFQKVIGFSIRHKVEAMDGVVAKGVRDLSRVHYGAYPRELGREHAARLRAEFNAAGLLRGHRRWSRYLSRVVCGKAALTDRHLASLASDIPACTTAGPLSGALLPEAVAGSFIDEIVSIEREEAHMHDVCVPDGHAFVGNVFINHNSQGMTLSKVYAYIGDCFEAGQAYVALSRARSLGGLFIKSSRKGCIRADKAAVEFCAKAAAEQARLTE